MNSISPRALLELYEQTLGSSAPDACLLHVRGMEFELGDGISSSTRESVDESWKFLDELLASHCESWRQILKSSSASTSA